MAPQGEKTSSKATSGDKMKQKSLMAFFNKAAPAPATSSAKPKVEVEGKSAKHSRTAGTSKTHVNDTHHTDVLDVPATPVKGASQRSAVESPHGTRSSNVPSSPVETPPTSDIIDVDMAEDDDRVSSEQKGDAKSVSTLHFTWSKVLIELQSARTNKRKIVIDDSDEEDHDVDAAAYRKGLSAYQPSPEPKRPAGKSRLMLIVCRKSDSLIAQNKKARVSAIPPDDEESSGDESRTLLSKRLSKFRPPVAKSKREQYSR